MKLTAAVLLCTKNRTGEVRRFLESIRAQSRCPDEILVIDGAAQEEVRAIASAFSELPIRYLTVKGDLTAARNLGIRESQSDVLFFLDDDLVLHPAFVENILEEFESDATGAVGGVCGTIEGYRRTTGFRALMNRVFFMPGDGTGKFKRSGAPGWVYAETEPRDVDFLPGGLTAYRRQVFEHGLFDEALPDFGYTDDVDFSYRVSRRFKNRYCPAAIARHVQPASERAMDLHVLRTWIWAYWRTYVKNRRKDWMGYPALLALTIGYGVKFFDSLWRNRPTAVIALALTAFLTPMFVLNKGFAYTRVWIGPLPVFITEIVLIGLAAAWILLSWRKRRFLFPVDPLFWLCAIMFLAPGLLSWTELASRPTSQIIDALKRSALFYYAAFAILLYSFSISKRTIEVIFRWTLIGAVAASFIDIARPQPWFPANWPVSVGIARETTRAVAVLFILFALPARYRTWLAAFAGAFMLTMIVTTVRRSALLTFIGVSMAAVLTLLLRPLDREERRWLTKVAMAAAPMILFHVMLFGTPQSITRFGFLKKLIGNEASGVTRPAPPARGTSTDIVPQGPVPTSLPRPTSVPPSTSRSVPTNLTPRSVSVPQRTPPTLEKQRQDFGARVLKVLQKEDGGSNVGWRGKVWSEGLRKGMTQHVWLGAGVASPFIAESVSPYKSPQRRSKALAILRSKADFSSRMATETDPSQTLMGYVPLPLEKDEGSGLVSPYWYNIDFHNSHIAVFYRLGLIGFAGYAGLLILLIFRLGRSLRLTGDGVDRFLLLTILWYVSVAAFNVALEGPFLGAVFWIFVGFGFCSASPGASFKKTSRHPLTLSTPLSEPSLTARN